MRLKQIKLAGFKSFVDPTAFDVPGQLVGVVGPNGCGKSNIMDAVRWVLGESKASELRGESMQDVIFNGSSDRKPAARASVELIFDNSLGRIGGSWGQFAEISVKRVLTRDGNSSYLINNQVVRRRDVHDMFLGTGLGPRAYAIIGQGMISRIIEARPEELRVFLEEAAGVSKYKERRRETSNRLADTRENLNRVEDIRRELGNQIERLERQAEVAQRFRELEAERERKQQMHWLVRRDEARREQAACQQREAAARTALEAKIAEQRALEAEIEARRAAHYEAGDAVHAEQARFYESNAEVARLEAEIRHVDETSGQIAERLATIEADAERLAAELRLATEGLERARSAREEAEARHASLEQSLEALAESSAGFEAKVREAREALDAGQGEVTEIRRGLELCSLEQRNARERLERLEQRRQRLAADAAALREFDPVALEDARAGLAELEAREEESAAQLEQARAQWQEHDARRAPAHDALRETEAKLAQVEARIAALRDLQERVESQAKVGPWLARHGLERMKRLWQHLHIEPGWETAIESVMRERVGALEVSRLDHVLGLAGDAPPAKVAFFDAGFAPGGATSSPAGSAAPLAALVRTGDAGVQALVTEWLAGHFQAPDIETAMRQRAELPAGGRFVVPAGHAIGRGSVQLYAADNEQEGVLARQQELENLDRVLRATRLLAEEARSAAHRAESGAAERLRQLETLRESHADCARRLGAARLEAQRLAQEAERVAGERERVAGEQAESEETVAGLRDVLAQAQARFETLDESLAERQEATERLREALEAAEAERAAHHARLREAERAAQEALFATRSAAADIERFEQSMVRAQEALERGVTEASGLRERLARLSAQPAQQALQSALAARADREQALGLARQRLDDIAQQLRSREEARLRAEHEQEPIRAEVADLQLKEQAARIGVEQFDEQLRGAGLDEVAEAALLASMAEERPRASWLQGEVTRLGNSIAALGAVNLAALEELAEAGERKGFLDAQSADLGEAIETLEDAIRRIDRETRQLLQETYDTVNRHFGALFPQLFGGGEARLILTGDEILDAGVQVMAQPPGKRNTSIHQLSGGEKALTAIALVFALFQLNPAPFCLLDEVDAPLDEPNTERYVEIVRRMSDQTQFLFITHNKIAMELASQLIGVTMQERGVSRIVAVDLDRAVEYAEVA
ncbi:MAG: chromosome segregation protein SMC [Burkholderiaceae bacterium]|nr:chromosome segregation protein SMC [Burkholderiaceae bacterium]MEB2320307.1 chromosome segregation protein SMC [Pseudomonadota bacterium]